MKTYLSATKIFIILLLSFFAVSCETESIANDEENAQELVNEDSESNLDAEENSTSENEEITNGDTEEINTEEEGDAEDDEDIGATEDPLMQATIGGVRYDVMKPFAYPYTDAVTVFEPYDEERYLRVQGFAGNINGSNVQIEFRIKQQFWKVGTHDLVAGDLDDTVGVYIIINDREGTVNGAIDYEGTFTITSFDLENHRIQGTFEFPFRYAAEGATEYEILQITGGTFDYPLDDEEFHN